MSGFDEIKNVILENIESKKKITDLPASKLLNGGTTFANFYNVNKSKSSVSSGFEDVNEYVGTESPIRFDYYKDLPLLGVQSFGGVNLTYDEVSGFNLPRASIAFINPNTIEPVEGSVFSFPHENNIFLYIINLVHITNIQNKPYYRIEYSLLEGDVPELQNILDTKQTVGRYKVLYDRIGGEDKCIIKESSYDLFNTLNIILKDLNDLYVDIFYDKRFNNLVYLDEDNMYGFNVYNIHLIQFLKRNPTLYYSKNTMLQIPIETLVDKKFMLGYNETIFKAIEDKKNITTDNLRFVVNQYVKYFNYNILNGLKNLKIIEKKITSHPMDVFYDLPFNISNNIDNMILRYTQNTIDIPFLESMINTLLTYTVENTLESYTKTPIVLYILRKIINDIFLNKEMIKYDDYLRGR